MEIMTGITKPLDGTVEMTESRFSDLKVGKLIGLVQKNLLWMLIQR